MTLVSLIGFNILDNPQLINLALDNNEYPTRESLQEISIYTGNFITLMNEIQNLFDTYGYYQRNEGYSYFQYKFGTTGWSGIEDVIEALQSNRLFWGLCWYSSQKGGHYEFRVPKSENKKDKE